jgi:hypothetical protein
MTPHVTPEAVTYGATDSMLPRSLTGLQAGQNQRGRGFVGGYRHIVHVADAQQALDV